MGCNRVSAFEKTICQSHQWPALILCTLVVLLKPNLGNLSADKKHPLRAYLGSVFIFWGRWRAARESFSALVLNHLRNAFDHLL